MTTLHDLLTAAEHMAVPQQTVNKLKALGLTHVVLDEQGGINKAQSFEASAYISRNGMPEFQQWNGMKVVAVDSLIAEESKLFMSPFTNKQFTPDDQEELLAIDWPDDVEIIPALFVAKEQGTLKYDDLDDFIWDYEAGLSRGKHKPSVRRVFHCWEAATEVRKARAREQMRGEGQCPVAVPTPNLSPTSTQALQRLLLQMFSSSEMRRLVRYIPNGSVMSAQLPGRYASPLETAEAVIDTLIKNNAIDSHFWAALYEERPRRLGEIDLVRAQIEGN